MTPYCKVLPIILTQQTFSPYSLQSHLYKLFILCLFYLDRTSRSTGSEVGEREDMGSGKVRQPGLKLRILNNTFSQKAVFRATGVY